MGIYPDNEPLLVRWRGVMPDGGVFHVARTPYHRRDRLKLHRHDFAELFWIERGRAIHIVNGRRVAMSPGDVTFIRPEDQHTLRTADRAGFVLINVACPVAQLEPIRQRYFGDTTTTRDWPWHDSAVPMQVALPPAGLDRLSGWMDQLATMNQSAMEFDAFLLDLLNLLRKSRTTRSSLPRWLDDAIVRMATPEDLAAGPARLAEHAHRSAEHLNRVIRKHLGQTTTELINDIRLERAGRLLRMTDRPIVTVAQDCGINNLSYFHRLFKARFGLSPRRYRQQQQALIRSSRIGSPTPTA